MSALLRLLAALALTVAVECSATALLLGRRAAYAALLCNLLTNPLLNALLLLCEALWPAGRAAALALLEAAVVAGEAALFTRLLHAPLRQSLPLSLLLNALSFGAGLLLNGIVV